MLVQSKVISTGILLLVLGLMSWVELAYSRPAAVKSRVSQSDHSKMNRSNNITTMWSVFDQKQHQLQQQVGMFNEQPDYIIYVKKKDEKQEDAIANVITKINLVVKNKTQSMPKTEADDLVKFLVSEVTMHKSNKLELVRNLNLVVRKHPHVAQSLKVLQEKIQDKKMRLTDGDFTNILIFVGSLREISSLIQPTESATVETVLLNLGAHVGEVVTWPDVITRENFLSLLKMYIRERADASGPAQALQSTLINRGYTDVTKRLNRMEEIFKN